MAGSSGESTTQEQLVERIAVLETRSAHQDATVDELNEAITAQWRTIDALTQEMALLADRVRDLSRREPDAAESPPPHY